MQQHPVPQNISSYEFKLVGDMTLKQFFQLAGGAVVALLFYASPLPPLIKWPLVLLFGSIGTALAFLPIQERPLSAWFLAFIKAVYSPTIYTFVPNQSEEVFRPDGGQLPEILTPQGEKKAQEYLSLVPQPEAADTLEQNERSFLQKISTLFQTSHITPPPVSTPTPPIFPTSPPPPLPNTSPFAQPTTVPQTETVKIESALPSAQSTTQTQPIYRPQVDKPLFEQQTPPVSSLQANFTSQAAPPAPPDRPNTVVGQVLTSDGEIVAGAILEIKDTTQKPVRALRTNKVGHFMTVTPLQNGSYFIEIEKEGLEFDPISFSAEGTIIQPILIRARS